MGVARACRMRPRGARANPNYGNGVATIDDDTPTLTDEEERLKAWLAGFLSQPGFELPRPPRVALEILDLSHKPSARMEDIARLLEREPLLAGRVLQLANSALYGGATPVTTLKMALVRMGLSTVRDVVMEAAFHLTVIRAESFSDTFEQVRRHSTAVAWLSRFIARHTSLDAENAFLIGLLHDVGLSVGLVALAEFCKRQHAAARLTPLRWLAVDSVHEWFTEQVLASWGLAPQVRLVVKHHHSLKVDGRAHPSIAVLLIAEQLAIDAACGIAPTLVRDPLDVAAVNAHEAAAPDEVDRALQALNLTPRHYQQFSLDSARMLETLKAQF